MPSLGRWLRIAIIDLAGKFHARLLHDLSERDDTATVLQEATHEVYTYSCAVASLVQAYRHVISTYRAGQDAYDSLKSEVFEDSRLLRFFSDLRNSNSHVRIVTARPHYSIKLTEQREVTSGLRFSREAILEGDAWARDSKALAAERTDLQVLDLINEHFKLAERFYRLVLFRTGIQSDVAYRDLLRLMRARRDIGRKVSFGIILQACGFRSMSPTNPE